MCSSICVVQITGIIKILKATPKGYPKRLSLVLDCCPHVCPQMGGYQVAGAPEFPSRDPWMAVDFGQVIWVFHLNHFSGKMALHEVSHRLWPVLLSDLAWGSPVKFLQLGLTILVVMECIRIFSNEYPGDCCKKEGQTRWWWWSVNWWWWSQALHTPDRSGLSCCSDLTRHCWLCFVIFAPLVSSEFVDWT